MAKQGEERTAMMWSIPDSANRSQDLCSALFNKLTRRWRLHLRKVKVLLEYNQGLDPIVAFTRYLTYLNFIICIATQ